MAPLSQAENRLEELLVDRATQGLTAAEAGELERLLEAAPDVDPSSFDLAAAAVHLTSPVPEEAIPAALEARLEERAADFISRLPPAVDPRFSSDRKTGTSGAFQRLGWYAAAACLAAAVAGWWPDRQEIRTPATPPPAETLPVGEPPADPRPEGLNLAEVLSAPDALRLAWSGTEDPAAAGAGGEVLWSRELQQGFMRFTGLPANDPSEYQYQLWIFDENQDERYPIDGGVFDVAGDDSPEGALVPIDPALEVKEPTLFAVTIEKPGGVVVSSRERLVLIAAAG